MINHVAIIIGDNDFGETFIPLLKTIQILIENAPNVSEDQISRIIEMGVEFNYVAYQLLNHYNTDPEHQFAMNSTVNYLKNHMRILYNEDAIEACCQADHGGGAWYLDVVQNQINSF